MSLKSLSPATVTWMVLLATFPLNSLPFTLANRAVAQSSDAEPQDEAMQLLSQGMEHLRNANATAAIALFQQALQQFKGRGDRTGEGRSFTHLALAYEFLNDYPQAIEYHQQALAISRALGNQEWQVSDLNSLGAIHNIMGNSVQAVEYSQQSLTIARDIGDRPGEGNALSSLGFAYFVLGDLVKAIDAFEQSLTIATELGDDRMAATAEDGLAQVQGAKTRRRDEAEELVRQGAAQIRQQQGRTAIESSLQPALRLFLETGDRAGEGEVLALLGYAYLGLGDLPQASQLFQQSLAIARELNDSELEAFVQDGLSQARGDREI